MLWFLVYFSSLHLSWGWRNWLLYLNCVFESLLSDSCPHCTHWLVRSLIVVYHGHTHFLFIRYTHYRYSSLIWRTVSCRVDEVIPSNHPRREASRVIQWYGLIHSTWYCTPDQVTIMIICLLYTFFWFYNLFLSILPQICANICHYVMFLDFTSSCFFVSGSMIEYLLYVTSPQNR